MTAAEDLHQRGLQAAAHGQFEEAVAWLARAVEAAPSVRLFRTNLGLSLVRLGRRAEATAAYRGALELEPGHAGTLAKLGRVLLEAGQISEAITTLERAARIEPANPDTVNALGTARAAAGGAQVAGACAAFRRAVELDPGFGEAWRNLGLLAACGERWTEAAAALERAVALEPPSPGLAYHYGVALARTGCAAEAKKAYLRAVALDPKFCEAWNNLGHQCAALGESAEALEALQRALEMRPDYLEARYNLGVTLQSIERTDEARAAYQLVLAASGAHADALNNLGGLCLSEGAPRQAIPLYQQALAANEKHPEARWNLGLAHLSVGDWLEGWKHYEARPVRREFAAPRWRRDAGLAGRTVLLWCEQGLGDGVQFLRLAGELRRLGAARLTVECPGALAPLLRTAERIDEVAVRGEPLPKTDYQISLLSLPFELELTEESIPAPGPHYRLEARRAAWRARLDELDGGTRKIGIVWGGRPENRQGLNRSMPLDCLAGLAQLPGVTLINLQHGPQCAELAWHPEIVNWPQQDLADTAALAAEVDLIITIDTLMAHLAGTVARRAWVMLPLAADWRWMTARDNSPWYPRMRLFRQERRGDWAGVVKRVEAALRSVEQ